MSGVDETLYVTECSARDAEAWNGFVVSASGTYCHLFGWKQIFERTYGLQTHYLVFHSADAWLGILPLAVMPRLLGGAGKVRLTIFDGFHDMIPTAPLACLSSQSIK